MGVGNTDALTLLRTGYDIAHIVDVHDDLCTALANDRGRLIAVNNRIGHLAAVNANMLIVAIT